MLGSIYTYCSNICPGLKCNQNATFGAHRLGRKIFPYRGSNPGLKNYGRLYDRQSNLASRVGCGLSRILCIE